MLYKIIKVVDISGNNLGDIFEAEPHAMEAYIKRNEVEEVKNTKPEVKEESHRDKLKRELTEKGIEFKGNAKTELLKELNK